MNAIEISKKGLFLFEQNWKQSEKIAQIFPFGKANDKSDFLTIAKSALEQKHDFVFVMNDRIAQVVALNNFDIQLKGIFYPNLMFIENALKSYVIEATLAECQTEKRRVWHVLFVRKQQHSL